jgi:hypothetical protein
MVGRGLRPNRGFTAARGRRVTPRQTNRGKMSEPRNPSGRFITEYRTMNEPLVPLITAGHVCGFMHFPGSAGKPRFGRSLSLPSDFA